MLCVCMYVTPYTDFIFHKVYVGYTDSIISLTHFSIVFDIVRIGINMTHTG